MNDASLAVVGLGYVGLPLALLASSKGYKVIGIDTDTAKVQKINARVSPFTDKEISRLLETSPIEASTDYEKIADAAVIIICVPTPVFEDNSPNLNPIKSACSNIASFLKKGQLVILESTVNPGVTESIVIPLLEQGSDLEPGHDFHIAHCPERINPGDAAWNVENINRVIGSLEENGLKKAIEFYQSILIGKVTPMGSLKEAEAVKVVENAFRDINIAFVNELAQSFSKLGIDVVNVINGAATKPFAFMPHYPGCGVGGHCIPVDPYYLIDYAKRNGFDHDFLSLARRINSGMPKYLIDVLIKALNEKEKSLKGCTVTVLGLAYKPEIDDLRESPSVELIQELKNNGADVIVYDPFVPAHSTVESLDQALKGSFAVIIATAHKCFRQITPDQILKNGIEVVVDGRNCLPKQEFLEANISYVGIGR